MKVDDERQFACLKSEMSLSLIVLILTCIMQCHNMVNLLVFVGIYKLACGIVFPQTVIKYCVGRVTNNNNYYYGQKI